MADIVAGFMMPHDPLMTAIPEAPSVEQREDCMRAYSHIVEKLRLRNVDTAIVIGSDHYSLNGPKCIPRAMIGVGDVEGPIEAWLGLERKQVATNQTLATHIASYGFENGVDWAVSKSLSFDHAIAIPYHFVCEPANLRTIPVYINAGFDPIISSKRAFEIGQSIGAAIRAFPGAGRVAIFGTGGLSHWPGTAGMGNVNETWDRQVLGHVAKGDAQSLIDMRDEDTLAEAGNGGLEIKNWICAMGALSPCEYEIIAYQPVREWIAGCGYAEMISA